MRLEHDDDADRHAARLTPLRRRVSGALTAWWMLAFPVADAACGVQTWSSTTTADTHDADAGTSSEEDGDDAEGDDDPDWLDDGDDDAATDDGSDFISPYDMTVIPMCDPFAQNCPDGEKCAPVVLDPTSNAWDGNVCVPAGDQPIGAPCSFVEDGVNGQDTCAKPGLCWGQDPDTGIGRCIEQCSGPPSAASCPITGVECTIGGSSGILNLCLPTCDPLAAACWAAGLLCIAMYTSDFEAPDRFVCVPPGTAMPGGPGDACVCANCCQSGTLCEDPNNVGLDNCPGVDPSLQACCTALCDVNLPDPDLTCAEAGLVGTVCVALTPPDTPEPLGKVGKCVLPP